MIQCLSREVGGPIWWIWGLSTGAGGPFCVMLGAISGDLGSIQGDQKPMLGVFEVYPSGQRSIWGDSGVYPGVSETHFGGFWAQPAGWRPILGMLGSLEVVRDHFGGFVTYWGGSKAHFCGILEHSRGNIGPF